MDVSHLPPLLTLHEAAAELGLKARRVRLLAQQRRIAYIPFGSRIMIPRDAIPRFIADNTVPPCLEETPVLGSVSLPSEAAITSSGRNPVARGSAARARQIASLLKSRSTSSSGSAPDPVVLATHQKF